MTDMERSLISLIALTLAACNVESVQPVEQGNLYEYRVSTIEAPTIRERLRANGYTDFSESAECEGFTTFHVPYENGNQLVGVRGALGEFEPLPDGPVRVLGIKEHPNKCPTPQNEPS